MATFGNETIGTSSTRNVGNNQMSWAAFTMGGTAGSADSITVYLDPAVASAGTTFKAAIYKHSDSSLVGQTTAVAFGSTNAGWRTATISSGGSLEASTDYILVAMSNIAPLNTCDLYWSAGSANQGHNSNSGSYAFPDPGTFSHSTENSSIYCTYTPGTAPPAGYGDVFISNKNLLGVGV